MVSFKLNPLASRGHYDRSSQSDALPAAPSRGSCIVVDDRRLADMRSQLSAAEPADTNTPDLHASHPDPDRLRGGWYPWDPYQYRDYRRDVPISSPVLISRSSARSAVDGHGHRPAGDWLARPTDVHRCWNDGYRGGCCLQRCAQCLCLFFQALSDRNRCPDPAQRRRRPLSVWDSRRDAGHLCETEIPPWCHRRLHLCRSAHQRVYRGSCQQRPDIPRRRRCSEPPKSTRRID